MAATTSGSSPNVQPAGSSKPPDGNASSVAACAGTSDISTDTQPAAYHFFTTYSFGCACNIGEAQQDAIIARTEYDELRR